MVKSSKTITKISKSEESITKEPTQAVVPSKLDQVSVSVDQILRTYEERLSNVNKDLEALELRKSQLNVSKQQLEGAIFATKEIYALIAQ